MKREVNSTLYYQAVLQKYHLDNKIQSHLADLSNNLKVFNLHQAFINLEYIACTINQSTSNDLYMKYALILDKVYGDIINHRKHALEKDSNIIAKSIASPKYLV